MSHAFSMGAGHSAHEIARYFPLCNFGKVKQCNNMGEKNMLLLLKEGFSRYVDLNGCLIALTLNTQHMQAPARVHW